MKHLKSFKMSKNILIGPFTQLLPLSGLPLKGALKDEQLQVIQNGGVLVSRGKIRKVDSFENLKSQADSIDYVEGNTVCLPGFIDAHTHICFGGSRAYDYAMRNSGKTYLEIAKAGGGIWDTVTKTRKASEKELVDGIKERCEAHLQSGTTTLEIKSGYGLSVKEELKMLRAIREASKQVVQEIVPTCLAAHMKPKDWKGSSTSYLNEIATNLFPILKAENLSHRVDALLKKVHFQKKR